MSPFKLLSSKAVYQLKKYSLKEDELDIGNGRIIKHYTVVHPGAVVILPQISKDEFLFIRQYRQSLQKSIYEIPAGTLSKNEDPLECAKRELIEETDHMANEWISLGTIYPAPGFSDEIQYLYLARGLVPQKGVKDEDEVIETVSMSSRRIKDAILSGEFDDGKTLACILKAQLSNYINIIN